MQAAVDAILFGLSSGKLLGPHTLCTDSQVSIPRISLSLVVPWAETWVRV